jgi:hypothetical protein
MKKVMLFITLFFGLTLSALAQTTYTTTQDGCGGKALQYCVLPVTDGSASGPFQIVISNTFYGARLTLQEGVYPNQSNVFVDTGIYEGFVANPDGTRHPFNGIASFESTDGSVTAKFTFYAYYAATCSGRGCGGEIGWHYRILAGSTVTVQ